MKKKINNSLVLLALCMQYAPGKIVAVQGSLAETQIQQIQKENITGRLMTVRNKLDRLDKSQLAEKEYNKMYDSVGDLFELLHDKDEKSFKAKNLKDKHVHLMQKTQKVITAFRSKPLTDEEIAKASEILGDMENLLPNIKSKK